MREFVGVVSIALFAGLAIAQMPGNPENWCREGYFTRDSQTFRIAVANGGRTAKAYFYNDDRDNCPNGAMCQRKAFVVGGDELIVNRSFGDYSCVCLLYTSPSPRDISGSRMPSSA